MKIMNNYLVYTLLCLILIASGCASQSGEAYRSSNQRKGMTVSYGTVVDVRVVQISNDPSGAGAVLGGVAGGVLGNLFGRGAGRTLSTVAGAALGAAGGAYGTKAVQDGEGLQITVRQDNGQSISVVQDTSISFYEGEKVMLLKNNQGETRVQKAK